MGVVVIDPDGNQLSEVTIENGDVVNACFVFEDISFRLQLIITGVSYEMIFTEGYDLNN